MTILFVLPWLPYPFTSGGRQAVYNGIKAVSDSADVIVTYFDEDGSCDPELTHAFCELCGGNIKILPFIKPLLEPSPDSCQETPAFIIRCHRFLKRQKKAAKKQIKAILGVKDQPIPQQIETKPYYSWFKQFIPVDFEFGRHIRSLVLEYNVDLVQCEMFRCAPAVYYVPDGVKTVFVHHELRADRYALERQAMGIDSLEYDLYLDYFRVNETALLNRYDAVITLSKSDKEKLISSGVTSKVFDSIAVVDSPSDLTWTENTSNKVLSFIGNDAHFPNVDGIEWFLDNCWNSLLQMDPEYRLQIIGKWSDTFAAKIVSKYGNVSFLGYVDNLPACIRNTVMIVPIRIGSGIRMKILEAASAGAPLVSTTVGAEGLPMVDGESCFISDTPDGFVDSIFKLHDVDIRSRFVRNANDIVNRYYSFDTFRDNRLEIYKSLCK